MDSEISGKLRVKDYFQSALYREKKMILIGMLPSFLLIYVVLPEDVSLAFSIFLYVLVPITVGILLVLVLLLKVKRAYTEIDSKMHKKVVKINEKGIQYGTEENSILFLWSDIREGIFLEKNILLYISIHQALIIPDRFFSSQIEKEEWVSFIKQYVKV